MGNLIPFDFSDQRIRVVIDDEGNPWFVASDVASVLGYRDAWDMVRMLDDDEKGTRKVRTRGGEQFVTVISESGLYHCCIKSRRDEAKPFRRWVTRDVLPSIRKTGTYALPRSTASRRFDLEHDSPRQLLGYLESISRSWVETVSPPPARHGLSANDIRVLGYTLKNHTSDDWEPFPSRASAQALEMPRASMDKALHRAVLRGQISLMSALECAGPRRRGKWIKVHRERLAQDIRDACGRTMERLATAGVRRIARTHDGSLDA